MCFCVSHVCYHCLCSILLQIAVCRCCDRICPWVWVCGRCHLRGQVSKESTKVKDALTYGVPIVTEAFLTECERLGGCALLQPYVITCTSTVVEPSTERDRIEQHAARVSERRAGLCVLYPHADASVAVCWLLEAFRGCGCVLVSERVSGLVVSDTPWMCLCVCDSCGTVGQHVLVGVLMYVLGLEGAANGYTGESVGGS